MYNKVLVQIFFTKNFTVRHFYPHAACIPVNVDHVTRVFQSEIYNVNAVFMEAMAVQL